MNAPEKIYVHEASASELTENLSYHIGYTHTDAFIKKAVEWLEENLSEYCDGEDIEYTPSSTYNVTILQNERMIEDFKKAMKQ